jgi:RNA exonuclease 1
MRIGKLSNSMNSGDMLAIDCEMVLCKDGTEAVVRLCVVDKKLEVTYYFTKYSAF